MRDTSFGRVVGVLVSPTKTFRAIAERPTWLAPLLVFVVLGSASSYLLAPKIDWQETLTTKLHRAGREGAPERVDIVLPFLEDHGTSLFFAGSLLFPWGTYPLLAAIFLLLFKRAGGELSFTTSLGVIAYGFLPWAVAALLSIPLLLPQASLNLYGPASSNLTAFAGPDTGLALWVLLSSIDLFSLWTIALLVIGYSIAAKVTRLRVAAWVVGLWVVWVAFTVGAAALEQL